MQGYPQVFRQTFPYQGFGGQWSQMNAPTWSCYCMQSAGVPRWMTQTVCWSWWRRMFKQVLRNGYLEACQRQKSAMETFARLPGYRVACLLFGHCQSPQTHPRLPRRKRSVFFRSLWIGLEQRVGWFTTPLTLAVPGLPIGGQEQQQRLLEHCKTILPLCMSMIFWRFSFAKLAKGPGPSGSSCLACVTPSVECARFGTEGI